MTEINLDYLFSRQTVLNEMANVWKGLRNIPGKGPIFEKLFEDVGKLMSIGGDLEIGGKIEHVPGIRGATLTNRKLRYFIYLLTTMYDAGNEEYDDGDGDGEEDEEDPFDLLRIKANSVLGREFRRNPELKKTFLSMDKAQQDALLKSVQVDTGKETLSTKGAAKDPIAKKAKRILGIENLSNKEEKELFKDPDKIYRAALIKLIEASDYAISDEFKKIAMDKDNILSFMKYNRTNVWNAYSIKKAGEVEDKYKMPLEDYDTLMSSVKPLLITLNRLRGRDKLRNPTPASASNIVNNELTDNIFILLPIFDEILEYVEQVQEDVQHILDSGEGFTAEMDEYDALEALHRERPDLPLIFLNNLYFSSKVPVFINMVKDAFSEVKDVGMSQEDIVNKLTELKPSNNTVRGVIDFIIAEFTASVEFDSKIDKNKAANERAESSGKYNVNGAYPQQHLDKVLDTPEKRNLFMTWFHKIYIEDLYSDIEKFNTKLGGIKSGDEPEKGEAAKLANYKRPEAEKIPTRDLYPVSDDFEDNRPDSELTPEERKIRKLKRIKAIEDELETGTYDDEDDPFKESYIMEYMTEQVKKDKHPKHRGQFVDLKTNKVKNYGQWLLTRD